MEMVKSGKSDGAFPWSSPAIPGWTRAPSGATTPNCRTAVFRSSTHAWIAIRLVYLAHVVRQSAAEVADAEAWYLDAHQRYVAFLEIMCSVAAAAEADLDLAAGTWNNIDQHEANCAITMMFCEREPAPGMRRLLATAAQRHFGFEQIETVARRDRDRPSRAADNQAAWERAHGGRCASCGAPTVSQRQHALLRAAMSANVNGRFRLTDTYRQANGNVAPLWSNRLLIAAKGVADHVKPWSCGGRTSPSNLVNVCAACNYSRNDSSLDVVRVATPHGRA